MILNDRTGPQENVPTVVNKDGIGGLNGAGRVLDEGEDGQRTNTGEDYGLQNGPLSH